MSDSKYDGIIVTPEFITLFPNLFEPRAFKRNGKDVGDPKFGLAMLFDNDDVGDMVKTAKAVAKAKFGTVEGVRFPFKDGDKEKARAEKREKNGDFYEGKMVLKASSKYAPGVVGPDKKDVLDAKKIYSGCTGVAELNFVATEIEDGGETKRYVSAYVNHYMKTGEGEKLTGRTAADAFANVKSKVSDDDVGVPGLDDLDDEIPF